MLPLLALLLISPLVNPYKFFAYNSRFASSHVNFVEKISDVLIDAGHEVVMLSPTVYAGMTSGGSTKARVIEVPQCARGVETQKVRESAVGAIGDMWRGVNVFLSVYGQTHFVNDMVHQCNATLYTPGLIEQLKKEKFDVAYTEFLDECGWGLFHLLGIENIAMVYSMAVLDGGFHFTHTPGNPSYAPSMFDGSYGDQMTFLQRVYNTMCYYAMDWFIDMSTSRFQVLFDRFQPGFPKLEDILAKTSLLFMNNEPLLDFPKPTTHRIIDIGGIVTPSKFNELNQSWSSIMDLRPKTVLVSFGTVLKAHLMPEEYKANIVKALSKFPDVTFIWKYEKPEHNIAAGVPNIITSTWIPQRDILHDPRLTAFITHCGQGSLIESAFAGVKLIGIPVGADQLRNGQIIVRNGVGVAIDKTDLMDSKPLEIAVRTVLDNRKFDVNAKRIAKMLKNRPFNVKEIFLKNMEFLAEYGPLRQLDHYGTKLNFFQYYLIDVFAFLGLCALSLVVVLFIAIRLIFKVIASVFRKKAKHE